MGKKYTGFNGNSKGKLPGTEEFMRQLSRRTNNALWNNGTWQVRAMRGKESDSVHGTGRAGDSSYRFMKRGQGAQLGRPVAVKLFDTIVANSSVFGLEFLIDYQFGEFGKSWRCDRGAWKIYTKQTVHGGGSADWFHWEISGEMAADASKVRQAFIKIFGATPC